MSFSKLLGENPIAVIGVSALFADAKNVTEFWNNIITSKDSITDVPPSRWSIEDYYNSDVYAEDKTYCKRGGFLPEIDFNPMEFGLPPNILEVTDTSQLLALITARDAFEDAGYGQNSSKFTAAVKERTGVVLGVGGGQKLINPLIARLQAPVWEKAMRSSNVSEENIALITEKIKKAYVGWNENSFPGLLGNVISGRVANRFDLGGLNSVVDAACAASLSGIKMALSELIEGRCDMMLSGGVDTDNSPFMYMSFSKTPAFSKSGNISPFSEAADGMLIGEGIGMIVLKRLADAERDGDKIYALIKGCGTSSDGKFKSIYAPRPSGQALAMKRAYEEAGYDAKTCGLIEAHGTGTGMGDPTEFTSLQMVFGENNPNKNYIALGSVKSQIGHTKSAAGAAGMVKAILALHHKVLPPTINVEKPNSKFNIDETPFYINTESRPWFAKDYPRRAGVSAFGFGGINVHITLEEYNGQFPKDRLHQPHSTVLIHDVNEAALLQKCKNILADLGTENAEHAFYDLVSSSDAQVIPSQNSRVGFVVTSIADAINYLQLFTTQMAPGNQEWEHPKGIFYRSASINGTEKVAALFSGQGAQYTSMGASLANAFSEINDSVAAFDKVFELKGQPKLSAAIYPIPSFERSVADQKQKHLTQTQLAQPAIGSISMGMYKVLKNAGFKANMFAGHSFGELTALWAAGVIDEATYRSLAIERGAAMSIQSTAQDAGKMIAVMAPEATVASLIQSMPNVKIANVNGPNQLVLGGSSEAILEAKNKFSKEGIDAIILDVSAAFHTSFVGHAQKPFADKINAATFNSPHTPVYSNTNAEVYSNDVSTIKNIFSSHMLNSVLFKNQIEKMYQDGSRVFVEFGPKSILTKLVKDILKDKPHYAIALNANPKKDSDLQLRQAYVQMQVLGLPLSQLDKDAKPANKPLALSKMNVKLSGANYVSDATKAAYKEALAKNIKVVETTTPSIKINETKPVAPTVTTTTQPKEIVVQKQVSTHTQKKSTMNPEVIHLLKSSIDSLKEQQLKAISAFDHMIAEQTKQSNAMIDLMQKYVNGQEQGQGQEIFQPSFEKIKAEVKSDVVLKTSNGNGSTHQIAKELISETYSANGHSSNGNGKAYHTETLVAPVVKVAEPVVAQVASTPSGMNNEAISNILLKVVSDKTGYPIEMLELSMDMEADLGIDSIKRVEIFGAITEQHPSITNMVPQELAELRTLDQIVAYITSKTGNTIIAPAASAPAPAAAQKTIEVPVAVSNVAPQESSVTNDDNIVNILLKVVSDKTGYPVEMLELSMDMEADLGIDSIKRVEIFGAITEQHPSITNMVPQELAELRTLDQIVKYIATKSGGVSVSASVPTTTVSHAAPVQEVSNATGQLDEAMIQLLLQVVSEKTGYPAEMLELSMDMEADLGIDSIKRVEIFGAITERQPDLTNFNPAELAELRTLEAIVNYISGKAQKKNLS
jgi:polyketide-type polyunsaturated fatty acid synthase PfaA